MRATLPGRLAPAIAGLSTEVAYARLRALTGSTPQ